jgi:Flp pilus assembly protein TadG
MSSSLPSRAPRNVIDACRDRIGEWRRAESGVAAVEFALIATPMLAMLIGLTDVTTQIIQDRKLTLLTRTVADLASSSATLTTSDVQNIVDAASATLQPYDPSTTEILITSVVVTQSNGSAQGIVDWSCGSRRGPRSKGESRPVPAAFASSTAFIEVETRLPYRPIAMPNADLRQSTPWPLREGTKVTLTASPPPASGSTPPANAPSCAT